MKKTISIIMILVLALTAVFASTYHTVPLGDTSYRIIKNAELRGIIPLQSDVKPYALNTVRSLLNQIMASDDVSDVERAEIKTTLDALDRSYGVKTDNSFKNFVNTGKAGFEGKFGNLVVGVKAKSDTRAGMDIEMDKLISSRNLATAYLMGDVKDWFSYDINFSFVIDKLDTTAYNFNDFEFTSDGQYFIGALGDVYNLGGEEGIGIGLSFSPEITTSFIDDTLRIQIGSFKRDWGGGINNLALSASARKFEGVSIQYEPTEWFRFTSLVGSLAIETFRDVYDRDLPTKKELFDNNYSIHRAEFSFGNFKADMFEAIVWKKRFELSYISPISIYWIAQNYQGDWDDLLGGFDFSYRFPGFGRVYLSLAIDEFTADIKHLFTNPRNMLAIQAGLEVPVNMSVFTLFTIQGTYIPPFFGTHYVDYDYTRHAWGDAVYSTEYANAGKGLSYPLNPDTLELLIAYKTTFKKGWALDVTFKDQIQSAQYTQYHGYSKNSQFGNWINAGMILNDKMDYDALRNGKYSFKKFFSYIWKNTVDIDVTVSKTIENMPINLYFGVNLIADWTRDFVNTATDYNYGYSVETGAWNTPYVRALVKLGFTVYY